MSQMRVSKGAKQGYNFNEYQVKEDKPKRKAKASHGFSLQFNAQEQLRKDKDSTPINLLNGPTPPPQRFSKPESEIKTVSSDIIMAETSQSELPLETSDSNIGKALFRQQPKQSLIKQIDKSRQEQQVQMLFVKLLQKNPNTYLEVVEKYSQKPQQHQRILSFFRFREIIKEIAKSQTIQKRDQVNPRVLQLENLISNQINKLSKEGCKNLNLNTFPEIFIPFLTNNLENYVDNLLSQDQTQKALTIANLTDKTFLNFPSKYASTHFKSELNCLRHKDLQLLKKSSWLLQLGVVAKIFNQNIYEYGGQIIQRQINFKKHVLPSQFLLFCIQWNQLHKQGLLKNRSHFEISQEDIINLVKSIAEVSYSQLWQFLIILKPYKSSYSKAYKMVLENIAKRIQKPKNFLQVISYSQVENKQITSFFNLYKSENINIKAHPQIVKKAKQGILNGLVSNKTKKAAQKLTEWVQLSQLEELQRKRNYEQYLIRFVQNYEKLQQSDFVNFENLLKTMRQIITDFRICCNYKVNNRNQTYQLLCQLERKLKHANNQYIDIIKGCKSFLQLKQGIFCLNENGKLKSIEYLHSYLQKQTKQLEAERNQIKRENMMKVLKNIEDTLLKMLQTNSGQIYLSQLCSQMKQQKESLFQPHGINKLLELKGTNFSILMQILGQNKNILNKMALLLGFR